MAPESETRRTLGGLSGPMRGRTDRRTFLKGAGLALAAGAAGSELTPVMARAASHRGAIPLKHVIVDCQENRSFDHYYGFAPFAGRFGVPAGYSQPDGQDGLVTPFDFTSLETPDIGHS